MVYWRYKESRGDLGPNNPGLPLSGTKSVGSTDVGVGTMAGSAAEHIFFSTKEQTGGKYQTYVAKLPTKCARVGPSA